MRTEAVLTPSELEIMKVSRDKPSIFTEYFFRPFGEDKGWSFDDKFEPKGKWQETVHSAAQKDITVIGGFGCLSYDSLIFDPVEDRQYKIGELSKLGFPIHVLSWDGERFIIAKATSPFRKGREMLYSVRLSDGKQIDVTAKHAFLTLQGYVPLEELSVGQRIGVHANWNLSTHDEDVPRYWKKAQDCQDDYCTCFHQHDEPPRHLQEGVQSFSRLQDDAPEHTHVCLQDGVQEHGLEHSHPCRSSYRLSMLDSKSHAVPLLTTFECPYVSSSGELAQKLFHQSSPQSACNSTLTQQVAQFRPRGHQDNQASFYAVCGHSASSSRAEKFVPRDLPLIPLMIEQSVLMSHANQSKTANCPPSTLNNPSLLSYNKSSDNDYITFPRIVSIKAIGVQDYYDLHVPVYENYLANGIVNHNTGKTVGIAMSACVWATLTRDFKFLNVAPKAWQAKLMYDIVLLNARNTRFDDLIWEKPRRPHPKIVIRYRIGGLLYESSLEFMSADKDATGILSWEGDWLHIDESGLLDNLEEVIINVGSRLRGQVRGRDRLGRFSMTSNSWDNFYLWYYFDQAVADPENFLSMVVSSRDNKNITPQQLQRMVARIPKDERNRFIEGARPEGRGRFFNKESIYACEDNVTGEYAQEKSEGGQKGYVYEKLHGAGVINYELPTKRDRVLMFLGDPGSGTAPQRNAPVWMGWDVTDFPRLPAILVAFWWGNGDGKIGPFIDKMLYYMKEYKPIYTGIDNTGPQKNMSYLINEHIMRDELEREELENAPGVMVHGVGGLDFSGGKKMAYLHALRLTVEAQLMTWPKEIVGIRSQLANYDPEKDKRIAQDIVATMAMAAHAIRTWFHVSPEELLSQAIDFSDRAITEPRRLTSRDRSRRASDARPPKR